MKTTHPLPDMPPAPPDLTTTPPPARSTKLVRTEIFRVPPAPAAVIVTHHPDGTVVATCRGLTGAGRNEDDALMALGVVLLDDATDGGD